VSYTPYYPSGWLSGETGKTPITPEALNHMEQGIAAAFRMDAPIILTEGVHFGKEFPADAPDGMLYFKELSE
jgi:hypothetical protein